MADTTVERLAVLIEANTKQYSTAITKLQKDTERALRASAASVRSLDARLSAIAGTATRVAGLFGVAFGAGAIITGARSAISSLGELADAADRAGVSAEKLQVIREAMEQTAGSADEADSGLQKFNVTLGKVANGSGKEVSRVFGALGVDLKTSTGALRDNADVLDDVFAKIGSIADPSRRAALASELFGKQAGPGLAVALADGGAALAGYKQSLIDTGRFMSNDMVAAGDRLDNEFKRVAGFFDTIWKKAVIGAGDAVGYLFDMLNTLNNQTSLSHLREELRNTVDLIEQEKNLVARLNRPAMVDTANQSVSAMAPARPYGGDPAQTAAEIRARQDAIDALADRETKIRQRIGDLENPVAKPTLQRTDLGDSIDLGGAAKHETDLAAFDKQVAAVNKRTEALEAEKVTIRESTFVKERAKVVADLLSAAEENHVKVTRDVSASIQQAADGYAKLAAQKEQLEQFYATLDNLAEGMWSAFDAVISKTKSAGQAVKDLILDLIKAQAKADFLRLFNPAAPRGPIATLLGGLFGGHRAMGGDVNPGQVYQVGERGPELFAPSTPGRIIPNGAGGGAPARIVIEAVPSGYVDMHIRNVSGQVAVQVTQAGIGAYDKQRGRTAQLAS